MSEDNNNKKDVYVDNVKAETSQNENLSHCNKSNNTEDLSNSFLDLNVNADNYAEDESCSAPVEILSEFLSTFMSHDYKSALYYCKLILLYEPDNEIVQDFYPLILEKIDLDNSESDEFADNEASSFSTKSESSTEYFSSAAGTTENTSTCSSLSSDEEDASAKSSE